MAFIIVGVLLLLAKLLDFGAPAVWPWWVILSPFGMAVIWWWWSDTTGRTKRLEMEKLDERREERRRKNLVALGIDPRKHTRRGRQAEKFKATQRKTVDEIEGKRDAQRKKFKDSIVHSRLDSTASSFDKPGNDGKK